MRVRRMIRTLRSKPRMNCRYHGRIATRVSEAAASRQFPVADVQLVAGGGERLQARHILAVDFRRIRKIAAAELRGFMRKVQADKLNLPLVTEIVRRYSFHAPSRCIVEVMRCQGKVERHDLGSLTGDIVLAGRADVVLCKAG